MDYKNSIVKLKIDKQISKVFSSIINDIPYPELQHRNTELSQKSNELIITYDVFYNILYKCVLEYIPQENEHSLLKAIKMMPKAIRNVKRININKKVIELQQCILDKYFCIPGKDNIKDKIAKFRDSIIEMETWEEVEMAIKNFEERMRNGLLKDLETLSLLLEQRER